MCAVNNFRTVRRRKTDALVPELLFTRNGRAADNFFCGGPSNFHFFSGGPLALVPELINTLSQPLANNQRPLAPHRSINRTLCCLYGENGDYMYPAFKQNTLQHTCEQTGCSMYRSVGIGTVFLATL